MLAGARDRSTEGARERGRDASRERGAEPRLIAVIAPARPLPAGTVLCARELSGAAGAEPSLAWVPPENDDDAWSFVGWGTAARVEGRGEPRLAEVREGAARLFERIDGLGALPFAPRLFGGFAFDARPDARTTDLARAWHPFGAASFSLPHILYAKNADRAFLAAFVPEDRAAEVQGRLDEMRRLLHVRCLHPTTTIGAAGDRGEDPEQATARRAWTELVARALSEINGGAFAKVVLSRTRHVRGARHLDPHRAFAFAEQRHPACARFLFAREAVTFLGATPERLLSVRGRRAITEALAGSIPRRAAGDDRAREELLASEKDRAEHAFVVDAIRAALAPLCEAIEIPGAPHVRTLAHVHHLATPIAATLRDHAHLLDLAARLHPTPALCGSPTGAARDFIFAREADPRGWYGGAVGWLDANCDGTLAVAIRSALVTPSDAWIYAGAGIVRGSDPEMEYKETTVKERAMRDALEAAS